MTYAKVEGQTLKDPLQDPRGLLPLTDEVIGVTAAAAVRERREGAGHAPKRRARSGSLEGCGGWRRGWRIIKIYFSGAPVALA